MVSMDKTLIVFSVFLLLLIPTAVLGQDQFEVNFISPLPTVEEGESVSFPEYIALIFQLGLGAAAILAVLMIVFAGIQYIGSAISPSGKQAAKDRMYGAIGGLFLILISVLLLRTINPDLSDFNFCIPPIGEFGSDECLQLSGGTRDDSVGSGATGGGPTGLTCTNCAPVSTYSFPAKVIGEGCALPGPCQVNQTLGFRLGLANELMQSQGVNWEVTEMWPPTVNHVSSCHYDGTCVDASVRSAQTGANINVMRNALLDANLRPVYEVQTNARRNELIDQGVPPTGVIVVGGINAEHFSVYLQ